MDKGYNRTKVMKEAKAEACGTKEPGLHPIVEKGPKPLKPSDKRILLEKLCDLYNIPPRDLHMWFTTTTAISRLEKTYGHPIKYLEDWCGFTEYHKLWEETKRDFVKKYYKGK